MKIKVGFVVFIGKLNVGKSIFLNILLNVYLVFVLYKVNVIRKLMKCIVFFKDKEGYES